jgi:hypothetical protein
MKYSPLLITILALTSQQSPGAILIDVGVRNGGFEFLGGSISNDAKATDWSTDPDGDVNNWVDLGGPAVSGANSGTDETAGGGIFGDREAYFNTDNLAYNLTTETIALGETFNFGFAHIEDGRADALGYLAYFDGTDILAIPDTDLIGGDDQAGIDTYRSSWDAVPGDWVGQPIALVLGDNLADGDNFPEIDNAFLERVPEPSTALLGGFGLLALLRRRR